MNDELVSIAHLLLDELEFILNEVSESPNAQVCLYHEYVEDAEAVINRAKEILSKYPI